MASVYVTVPNGDGWMHKHVHFSMIAVLSDKRHRVRHDCPTHRPYINNLHHCMWDFLNGGEEYWLSMDDDNPCTANPLDNVEEDYDLVGYPTPVWHSSVPGDQPYYWNALDKVSDGWRPHRECKGIQNVDAIGSGCFLVSRRVIEKLKDQQPFARQWGNDGKVQVGGDYSFCDKVNAAGFQIVADYNRPCRHFVEVDLLEMIQRFAELKQ